MEATWPSGERWPGGGTITFEWDDSGAHLIERGTVKLPEAPDNVSIVGCDAANGTYFQLYSDQRGVCRVYEMTVRRPGVGLPDAQLANPGHPASPTIMRHRLRSRRSMSGSTATLHST